MLSMRRTPPTVTAAARTALAIQGLDRGHGVLGGEHHVVDVQIADRPAHRRLESFATPLAGVDLLRCLGEATAHGQCALSILAAQAYIPAARGQSRLAP